MYEATPNIGHDFFSSNQDIWLDFFAISKEIQTKVKKTIENNNLEEKIRTNIEKYCGKYLWIDALNEWLKNIKICQIEIPKSEIIRLKSILRNFSDETMAQIADATEKGKKFLAMQLPEKIIIAKKEYIVTIDILRQILVALSKKDASAFMELEISDCIKKETRFKNWSSELKIWFPHWIKNSENKDFDAQCQYQKEALGKDAKVDADAVLATCFAHLIWLNFLEEGKFLRLNTKDKENDPTQIFLKDWKIVFWPAGKMKDQRAKIGACICEEINDQSK